MSYIKAWNIDTQAQGRIERSTTALEKMLYLPKMVKQSTKDAKDGKCEQLSPSADPCAA